MSLSALFAISLGSNPVNNHKLPTLISSSSMARFPRGATAMALCRTWLSKGAKEQLVPIVPIQIFTRWSCWKYHCKTWDDFDYSPIPEILHGAARMRLLLVGIDGLHHNCGACSKANTNSRLLLRLTVYTRISIGGSIKKKEYPCAPTDRIP